MKKTESIHPKMKFGDFEISVFATPHGHSVIFSLEHYGDGPSLRAATHLTLPQLRETAAMLADVVKALDEKEGK